MKGLARYSSINYYPEEYIKAAFDDGSFLLIIPDKKEFYYSDTYVVQIPEITGDMIGKSEIVEYNGKKYKLENKDDFQYVLQLYIGYPDTIEGEVNFSDYFPVDGEKEFLSLGWIVRTAQRADVNPKILSPDAVSIS